MKKKKSQRILNRFKSVGRNCILQLPVHVTGYNNIKLGNDIRIGHYTKIDTFSRRKGQVFNPLLTIGNNVTMEMNCHIGCVNRVVIGDNCMLASNVYITDHNHGYQNPDIPYRDQQLLIGQVVIAENVWLGEGSMVMPNVTIGRSSIVAANAVVTKDIPSFVIVAGAPATIIKQYNHRTKFWEKVYSGENL